jgi:class 3 adenylate cyclase/CHASE2 domain-containing sensor protein
MNRTEKRLLLRTVELGMVLTLAVIMADYFGLLDPFERYLYDQRARHCQFFTPSPTDRIMHLDIDDASLKEIGWFPWPRTKMAEMIDELRLAGAKVIGMDILFAEPQDSRYEKQPDGSFKQIDDDQNFAAAVKRADNVLIPLSVNLSDINSIVRPAPSDAVKKLMNFALPMPPNLGNLLSGDAEVAPIEPLTEAAKYCGVVDFASGPDSTIRSVQLFVNYRGRLMPHMALAAACAFLNVPIANVKIAPDAVTLPITGEPPIVIPVHEFDADRFGRVGLVMDIPWFGATGKANWLTMYDYPNHVEPKQHMSLEKVWEICQSVRSIYKNNQQTDEALRAANEAYPSDKTNAFLLKPNDENRRAVVEAALNDMSQMIDPSLLSAKPEELKGDDAKLVAAYKALRHAMDENQIMQQQIEQQRMALRNNLNGKYALFGFTATGKTDFYPTSLHSLCPGVVVQGVVFNAIVTRHLWNTAPWWFGAAATLVLGALTTFTVALLPAWRALGCMLLIVGGYAFLNGIVMFDHENTIVNAAGPVTASALIWFGVTVSRFIHERRERSRITKRFSSYVDPMLVNFVVEHPEEARFDGQLREMTIVFTDLAGFTTISEKLRERTVPLLNEYMSLMLPVIRQNRGYWNKFLGDGIMFFFNAPADNSRHARDAVCTVLEMQKCMQPFNERLLERGLPQVAMRAGISTGMVVVGDAGSTDPQHHASDYTVLGDEVNLAARLESANKALGSRVLLSDRTAATLGDEFLLRPMGNFQVMGRSEGVVCFEALCPSQEASDAQKKMADCSTQIVENFRTTKFQACIDAAESMEQLFGSSKFTQLYLHLSREYLNEPPDDQFNGLIVLAEK